MKYFEKVKKPSKEEQFVAMESYETLAGTIDKIQSKNPEIEIEETQERIKIPFKALKLLVKILKAMGQGKPISIVPVATEMTTQAAADFLGCSRPHLVGLLESGEIPFVKIGKHRRVKFEDLVVYKKQMKKKQKTLLEEIMKSDQELGLYDT